MKLSKIDQLQPEIDVILSVYKHKISVELARPLSLEIKLVDEFDRPGFNFFVENDLEYSVIFPKNFCPLKVTKVIAEIFTEHNLSSQIIETPGFQQRALTS